MEREVNNGGWDQFFLNTDHQFDAVLVIAQGSELDEYDTRYYANLESIEERLFDYIANHQHEIRLP
jgi:hypothetical protein